MISAKDIPNDAYAIFICFFVFFCCCFFFLIFLIKAYVLGTHFIALVKALFQSKSVDIFLISP